MSPPQPEPSAIVREVRTAMLGHYRLDSCIAATRLVIAVCRYFGIDASPQPVRVVVFTPAAWAQRETLAGVPKDDWPPGAWAVGTTGGPSKPGRWNGHLVAMTATGLLDPSLDQFSRPQRGLIMHPAAWALPRHWQGPGRMPEDEEAQITRADGTVIIYGALADQGYQDSPNWARGGQGIRQIAGAAIRALL